MVKSVGNLSGLGAFPASGVKLSHSRREGKGQGCGPEMELTKWGQRGPATQCETETFLRDGSQISPEACSSLLSSKGYPSQDVLWGAATPHSPCSCVESSLFRVSPPDLCVAGSCVCPFFP